LSVFVIRTPRLILRSWVDTDYLPYAALNADPEVRRFWPSTLSREESNAQAVGIRDHIEKYGFGFWAVEVPGISEFIGFVGLKHVDPKLPFAPAVEAGWRLAKAYWGQGYAAEGARAALTDGFVRLNLPEIVAYASADNLRSRRVMERIGMRYAPAEDFDYVDFDTSHGINRCVLYRKQSGSDISV